MIEPDCADVIGAQFGAGAQRQRIAEREGPLDAPAVAPHLVVLPALVAVDRIVEEKGEVVEQAPVVVLRPGGDLPRIVGVAQRQALALGAPGERLVERAVAVLDQRADGAFGDLLGRVPGRPEAVEASLELPHAERHGVLGEGRIALVALGQLPRAVVELGLRSQEKVAGPELGRAPGDRAVVVVVSGFDHGEGRHRVAGGDEARADEAEIAGVGAVGALAIIDPLDDFGDQAVDVEVPLAVAVGAEVLRHVVDVQRVVGAVVEVETAQEVLVRLAAARMLRGDQTGGGFEQFAGAQQRTDLDVGTGYPAFARCCGDADALFAAAVNDDFGHVGDDFGGRVGLVVLAAPRLGGRVAASTFVLRRGWLGKGGKSSRTYQRGQTVTRCCAARIRMVQGGASSGNCE